MMGYGRVYGAQTNGTLEYITQTERKYQHLVNDDSGGWTIRADVRSVYKNSNGADQSTPLQVGGGVGYEFIGPELQVGHVLGSAIDEPVMLLKVGVGNRALGWDMLPPGVSQYQVGNRMFAGHGQCPPQFSLSATEGQSNQCGCITGRDCDVFWSSKQQCKDQNCWCKAGSVCPRFYAGYQYDDDLGNAKEVLGNIGNYFPGYKNQGFEVAGYFFWQGFQDAANAGHSDNYFSNLVQYIKSIRQDYSAYGGMDAPFVLGSIGFRGCDLAKWNSKNVQVWQAQMDVSGDAGIVNEFVGNVKTIDARSFWRKTVDSPANEDFHYHRNANTYLEMGTKMGWAMVDFLRGTRYLEEPTC
jgi:alpha-galactosidase